MCADIAQMSLTGRLFPRVGFGGEWGTIVPSTPNIGYFAEGSHFEYARANKRFRSVMCEI